jgi:uncharacterized repeat protein (TIGR03803 family)
VFELVPKAGGGWTEKVLHRFSGMDGAFPVASLILDTAGNLYGTTKGGGRYDSGTVFELTPKTGGGWREKVLHNFNSIGSDGIFPYANLIFDASGNLYGTTYLGGRRTCNNDGNLGCGTVFELMPQPGGGWREVLHRFNGKDGDEPLAGVIFDSAGNLYGTTSEGGSGQCDNGKGLGCGTVFELMPKAGGGWREKVLHNFNPNGKDGTYPEAGLIFDATGNLYGTTFNGGTHGWGTAFELVPEPDRVWRETVLHNFGKSTDGVVPAAQLIFDVVGNLYGTTFAGGAGNTGIMFELMPKAGGGWKEKVLHTFENNKRGGTNPWAGLIPDTAGNLYGTTSEGGAHGYGTVFEIAR